MTLDNLQTQRTWMVKWVAIDFMPIGALHMLQKKKKIKNQKDNGEDDLKMSLLLLTYCHLSAPSNSLRLHAGNF